MWPLISPASGACISFILALMSEWPVFHITGLAPAFSERLRQHLGALHVEDHRRARPEAAHRVAAEEDQELVAVEDLARLVHRADAVGVAIERDAELRAGPRAPRPAGREVLGHGRVGMMVREGAVRFAEERRHLGAERLRASATAITLPTPLPQSTTTLHRPRAACGAPTIASR